MSFELKWIEASSPQYEEMLRLREEVLRKPLGLKLEVKDESHLNLLTTWRRSEIVGCLVLEVEPTGKGRMRAVAVSAQVQGQGVGALMVKELEAKATELGCTEIYAHARQPIIGFYKALGYAIEPDVFVEVTIPHQVVRKRLS